MPNTIENTIFTHILENIRTTHPLIKTYKTPFGIIVTADRSILIEITNQLTQLEITIIGQVKPTVFDYNDPNFFDNALKVINNHLTCPTP